MAEQPELTLEDLLREPIILKLMERDGYRPDDIRTLARQAVARGVKWESRRRLPSRPGGPCCTGWTSHL